MINLTNGVTFGSLFSGCGTFDRAFEQAGMACRWQVEIDKTCRSVLARHWPDVKRHVDVREVGKHNLEPVDVICGGFPCQDLSIAGKRAGLAGERSGLFFEAARIVGELKPSLVLIENVPGLLSAHAGRDFAFVLAAFRELGARDIAWRVLDAQYCGVAQQRRRVLLVADFGSERAGEVLFESARVSWHPPARREAGQRVAGTLADSSGSRGWSSSVDCCMWTEEAIASGEAGAVQEAPRDAGGLGGHHGRHDLDTQGAYIAERGVAGYARDVAYSLTARNSQDRPEAGAATKVAAPAVAGSVTARYGKGVNTSVDDGALVVAHALTSEGADASEDGTGRGTPPVPVACPGIALRERGREGGRNLEMQTELAYALTNPGDGGRSDAFQVVQGWRVRRLTPRECERLQGLEDDYTRWRDDGTEISDSARYRMLGNAGAVPVFEWVGRRIVQATREGVPA